MFGGGLVLCGEYGDGAISFENTSLSPSVCQVQEDRILVLTPFYSYDFDPTLYFL